MSKVSDYKKATSLTGDNIAYLVQDETDKQVSLDQIKDFVLEGRELNDDDILKAIKESSIFIKDPKW